MSPDFVRIAYIINQVTGADVPVDIEIHRDDIPWLIRLWQDTFMLEWEIERTAAAQRALLANGATVATQLLAELGIPDQN